jgi:diguanylate cyclase (GGDEF)-like protein
MDAQSLLAEVLANYLNVMGFSCGAIYLAGERGRLSLAAQIGFPELAVKSLPDFFGHEGLLRDAMLKGEPLSISISPERFNPISRLLAHLRAETLLISPLRFGNEALGVSVLLSDTPTVGSDWVTFSRAITNQMGQVIALSRAISRLQYLASYDSLTDLPNRAHLRERLQESLAAGNRSALYLLNLDHFQEINNTLGYRNGNLLLQQVAKRLTETVADGTLVARLGADEFAVLSPNPPNTETVYQGARDILESLAPRFRLDGLRIAVRGSIGIALAREEGDDADTLLSHADMAQRAAKKTGNDYIVYPMHVQPYSPDHLALLGELREAVDHDKLILHYQPKVSFRTGLIAGVESLIRWPHPNRGWVAPDRFIPLAEKAGLIHPLTLWVLGAALRQARLWRDRGLGIDIAVNISARDLLDASFPDFVDSVCRSSGIPHRSLTLEITERDLMTDPAKAETAFHRLNQMGIHFAIDDFGTGYSALAHLQKLSVNEIKIDKSFVAGLLTDQRSAAIVRSIIDLGRNLGLNIIAEGVEDQRVWEHLAELGCDVAQGYRICRPLPPDELISWLGESSHSAKQSELTRGYK